MINLVKQTGLKQNSRKKQLVDIEVLSLSRTLTVGVNNSGSEAGASCSGLSV